MVLKWLNNWLGDPHKKDLVRIQALVEQINKIDLEYQSQLSDEDIAKKTAEFKNRVAEGESLDHILPEAFALVKDASRRLVGKSWMVRDNNYTWDMVHFDVQLIGGVVLHEGKIAEMKTGEGKTLVATLPIYLNALAGKGVHVVTVNEYLAQRDAEWMGGLFKFLGLSIGVNLHGQNAEEKKAAYAADITYGTNNEFGFDYLRDNMRTTLEQMVQRDLNYAIVDEVDSILIDEARTPLIISAPAEESTQKYLEYDHLVQKLQENDHYAVDEKMRVATLSEEGITKMENLLGVENIYTDRGFTEVNHIEQALRARAVYKRDVDYVVKDNAIMIVDEFTGRLMPGRRFGQGLHQAIEAKEGVTIQRESKTLATITFQNYFRMYAKLAGMTGTAKTEEEEFISIYGLPVMEIPTHRALSRKDLPDGIYKNVQSKFKAIAKKTKELHENGQPVLIGTISVEKSEALSKLLQQEKIPHHVLNAKQHDKEAEIIAKAGHKGAVTIATNMAGRGTDIKLGEGVKELGGLYVLGSERHESRRIDNQLRGRSGRQGDPGSTQFYVAMDDDLMRIFGGSRIGALMERFNLPDDMPVENVLITRSIESAQKKVEGRNFDIRKHLVQYDDVMNTHRDIVYKRRRKILESESLKNEALLLMETRVEGLVTMHGENLEELLKAITVLHRHAKEPLTLERLENKNKGELIKFLSGYLEQEYLAKEKELPDPAIMRRAEKVVMLRVLDTHWMEHVDTLKHLRDAVSLAGYGQRDPLIEYKNQAFRLFEELMDRLEHDTLSALFHVKINVQITQPPKAPEQKLRTNEDKIEDNLAGADNKPGRNDPCPCGSGKKFKKCHGENA